MLIHKDCMKAHPGGQLTKPGRQTNLENILRLWRQEQGPECGPISFSHRLF